MDYDKNKIDVNYIVYFLGYFFADQPVDVRLTTKTTSKVCKGVVVNFTCTAEANPAVHTYLLFENDTVIKNTGMPGTWIKPMKNAGLFLFRCEVNNSIQGIGKSVNTILTVDGEPELIEDHLSKLYFIEKKLGIQ